ncbi:MAG: NTP transferase domain-containing protein [Peptococcaceae bacterium]|nr:NTP transferase domain-containing protein [Peptococcaceae bacterium]
MGKIAALIPAAGYSSRMGLFKPLLPIASSLVLEKPIKAFRTAGVEDILVITGHKNFLLAPVLEGLGVKAVYNSRFDQGMYSSIQAGVAALPEDTEAFFLLPADYAVVSSAVISQILEKYRREPHQVFYPTYNGERGHPPLISAELRPYILEGEADGGLRGLLESIVTDYAEIPVDDEGILQDLDTEDDYRSLVQNQTGLAPYPTRRECEGVWQKYETPRPVILHAQQVNRVACTLCEYLNSRGFLLHTALVQACALLHDVAKGEKQHAAKGRQIVKEMGYEEAGEIIGSHMDLPSKHLAAVDEYSILYLADKLVQGSELVSLEKRLAEQSKRYAHDTLALTSMHERMGKARQVQQNIENILSIPLSELFPELARD